MPAPDPGLNLSDHSGSSDNDLDSGSGRDEERLTRSRWRERTERAECSETTESDDHGPYGRLGRGKRFSCDQLRRGRWRAQASIDTPENRERTSRESHISLSEDHVDAKATLIWDLVDATEIFAAEPQEHSRRGRDGNGELGGYDEGRDGRHRRGRKHERDRFDCDDRDSGREGRNGSAGRDGRNQSYEDEVLLPVVGILDVTDN